jgi:hypothetical protein
VLARFDVMLNGEEHDECENVMAIVKEVCKELSVIFVVFLFFCFYSLMNLYTHFNFHFNFNFHFRFHIHIHIHSFHFHFFNSIIYSSFPFIFIFLSFSLLRFFHFSPHQQLPNMVNDSSLPSHNLTPFLTFKSRIRCLWIS